MHVRTRRYNAFATQDSWWGASERGTVPIGWTISPALVELGEIAYGTIYIQTDQLCHSKDRCEWLLQLHPLAVPVPALVLYALSTAP